MGLEADLLGGLATRREEILVSQSDHGKIVVLAKYIQCTTEKWSVNTTHNGFIPVSVSSQYRL